MIGRVMQDAINEQINKELYSSYLYLSMAAYFADKNLPFDFANITKEFGRGAIREFMPAGERSLIIPARK